LSLRKGIYMHHETGGKIWIGFYCLSKIQHMYLATCCVREWCAFVVAVLFWIHNRSYHYVWLQKLNYFVAVEPYLPESGTLAERFVMQSGEMYAVNFEKYWVPPSRNIAVLANHSFYGKAEIWSLILLELSAWLDKEFWGKAKKNFL